MYHIAEIYRERGQLAEARAEMERVLHIAESLRAGIASQQLRASYFATMHNYYDFQTDLFMQLHKERPTEGFEVLAWQTNERARARSLLETLAEARADLRRDTDPNTVERERGLQRQLNSKALARMRLLNGKHTIEQAAAIEKEIEELTTEYQQVEAETRQRSPRYAALVGAEAFSLAEIEGWLDDNTLLLQYDLGEERSHLWAITPTSISAYELPRSADIEALARRLYDLLTVRNRVVKGENFAQRQARIALAKATYVEAATSLSRMLLGPVASLLGEKRLLIVADGVLQYIPFAVLPEPYLRRPQPFAASQPATAEAAPCDPVPLVVSHEVVSLPSASTLGALRNELQERQSASHAVAVLADPVFDASDRRLQSQARRKGKRPPPDRGRGPRPAESSALERTARDTGLGSDGIGLPRLPLTLDEAEAILSLAPPAEQLRAVGFQANREMATSPALGKYRVVHFATHGLLDSIHPELSGIVLSLVDRQGRAQDGFLRLHDIYNLKLPVELVVLSACQTGLGKEIKGEGLIGLTQGFMYAGAARVVASLWKIDDRATAELMKRFYEGMLGPRRLRPAAALRAAQAEMWKTQNWREPYYWAAFVLQGEWK